MSVRVHYAAPEAEIEKYLAACHVTAADVVTHDRRRRSRQFPVGAVKRLAPARREGKHFANGAAASLYVFVDSHFRRDTADKSNDKNRPQLHAAAAAAASRIDTS